MSPIVEELLKGNTYAQYDKAFFDANLNNVLINMNITTIIDLGINNAGEITLHEKFEINNALKFLNQATLSKKYMDLIEEIKGILRESLPNTKFAF